MRSAAMVGLALACGAGGCESAAGPGQAVPVARDAVRLSRGAHPLARRELDVGPLDPGRRLGNLSLVFRPSPEQARARDALRDAQLDPGSPEYRRWLTPEQYAARFGARPDDVARARAWLSSRGLQVGETSRLGTRVRFGGLVADVQAAFGAELRAYAVGGERHFAMAGAPSLPDDLADVVLAVHNTHDFYPHPAVHPVAAAPDYVDPKGRQGLGPPDWATLYDVAPLYATGVSGAPLDGSGVTIAVVGIAAIARSDLDAFRALFGLGPTRLTMTLVPDTGAPSATTGAGAEAILDTEWSGAIAKGATIDYVYTGADDSDVDDATYYAIEQDLAPIISESWGNCEVGVSAADQDVYELYGSAANLLGITYLAASGDSGAAGCAYLGTTGLYVDMPASTPGVTAVGGTEFPSGTLTLDGSGYVTAYATSEEAWHEGIVAGGGGISSVFTRPAYQAMVPTCAIVGSLPTGVTPSSMRQIPDVSASAAGLDYPYFVECTTSPSDCGDTGGAPHVFPISGTSASTPSIAGVMALVSQAVGRRLGNVNPILYAMQASVPAAFHDIALGDIEQKCNYPAATGCPMTGGQYGYAATAGYDCATGLGSLDAAALVKAWATLAPTATTVAAAPTQTSEGADVSLSATVAVTGSNANVLAGEVTFTFQSYTAGGAPDLSWTLGEAPVTGATVSGGAASLAPAPIPPGLVNAGAQYVDVVAMYGGDAHHLASQSARVRIDFSAFQLSIAPQAGMVAPGGTLQFTSSGGVAPVRFFVGSDGTCDPSSRCSQMNAATGLFRGGPVPGYVVVQALDHDGAHAVAHVTVGNPGYPPPWGGDAGAASDAGPDASADAGEGGDAQPDGAVVGDSGQGTPDADAGDGGGDHASPSGSAGGCSCSSAPRGGSGAGVLAALAAGLAFHLRRRRVCART